jgi:hypothetical protein
MVLTFTVEEDDGSAVVLAVSSHDINNSIHIIQNDGIWEVNHSDERYVMNDYANDMNVTRDFAVQLLTGIPFSNMTDILTDPNGEKPYIRFNDYERGSTFDVWSVK